MAESLRQKLKWKLVEFLARRLPPCSLMTRLFSESHERPLTMREKIIIKLHFFTCEACRRYVEQIAQMSEMVKPHNEKETAAKPNVRLSNDARERIKAALKAAAQRRN